MKKDSLASFSLWDHQKPDLPCSRGKKATGAFTCQCLKSTFTSNRPSTYSETSTQVGEGRKWADLTPREQELAVRGIREYSNIKWNLEILPEKSLLTLEFGACILAIMSTETSMAHLFSAFSTAFTPRWVFISSKRTVVAPPCSAPEGIGIFLFQRDTH